MSSGDSKRPRTDPGPCPRCGQECGGAYVDDGVPDFLDGPRAGKRYRVRVHLMGYVDKTFDAKDADEALAAHLNGWTWADADPTLAATRIEVTEVSDG